MTTDAQREEIAEELRRLEEDATYASQSQFEASKFWRLCHWVLGVPAAALAAIAGFTGLASVTGRVPAAILALIAAVLGGLLTTVEPNKRVRQGQTAGVAYNEVRVGARQARLVDLPGATLEGCAESVARTDGPEAPGQPRGRTAKHVRILAGEAERRGGAAHACRRRTSGGESRWRRVTRRSRASVRTSS